MHDMGFVNNSAARGVCDVRFKKSEAVSMTFVSAYAGFCVTRTSIRCLRGQEVDSIGVTCMA
jgi:hypothetical protein